MEDEILIKYLRKNDRKAYSILFDKYFERLFTFAVRVVFREDVANDIVQEIFISLYEKSEILNYDLSLKSYLFNSVRNRCFNYLRDRKVEDRRMNLYAEACLWSDNVDWIEEEEVLRKNPDVLLLDEPTNHLDIDSIQWLEDFLVNNGKAVVVISHDRTFVDNITTRTIEVTMGRIYDYKVNYSQYLVLRQERRIQQQKTLPY